MLRFALYQVLVIPPPPADDKSGLRGLPGITGELKTHITKLAHDNMSLRSDLHASPHFDDARPVDERVEIEFWKSFWYLETLIALERELGDLDESKDWSRAFRHAACANQENLYRLDLDMESAFTEDEPRGLATAYAIFTDIVVSGAADPLAEWLDYHAGQKLPVPGEPAPNPKSDPPIT